MVVMVGELVKLGQLERTPRAFWQDAWEAMRGDIARAIVEYVTNADDSYARKGGKGRILIEVEHRRGEEPWIVRIRDRAEGMTLADMRAKIGKQGVRASGFAAGVAVRGNLGVGSKDPACFGKVTFESIRDGLYAVFTIDDQGDVTASHKPLRVAKDIRDRLGIPANGTVVSIDVTHRVSCPRHETIKDLLRNHVLLRDIMQDPDRDVFLLHANKPGAEPERLRYEPPKVKIRVNKKGVPLPGYKGATANIVVGEADEPFPEEGRHSPTRQSGLLIKGRRAIYESTLFMFEGIPNALAFNGHIKCVDIDRLAAEYDDRAEKRLPHPVDNPRPIISRQRDGLTEDHPIYQAIRRLAEQELAPLVAEREKRAKERSRQVENAKTTRLLSQLSREAAKFMREAAEEEEIELPPGLTGSEPAPALAIVPPAMEMPYSSERTVTVMAAKDGLDDRETEVELSFAPPGPVQVSATTVKLGPSRRRDDVLTATVKLSAGPSTGATLLVARLGTRMADCAIEVLEPTTPPPPEPPADLEFERSRYRLVLNKPRGLRVRAPLGRYAEDTVIRIGSTVPGVVVLDGGHTALHSRSATLAMEGSIRVEGRVEQEKGQLTATDPHHRSVAADVEVVRREEGGAEFKTELVPDMQGDQRAQWSMDYTTLRVMGEHPAVKPYLGDKDNGYPGQDSVQARILIAELVTDAVVRRILLQKYKEDELDAATFYVEHYKLLGRFLARAHRIVAASQ